MIIGRTMDGWTERNLGLLIDNVQFMPVNYGCMGLKGSSIEEIGSFLSMLVVCIIILLAINTEALKKYRTL